MIRMILLVGVVAFWVLIFAAPALADNCADETDCASVPSNVTVLTGIGSVFLTITLVRQFRPVSRPGLEDQWRKFRDAVRRADRLRREWNTSREQYEKLQKELSQFLPSALEQARSWLQEWRKAASAAYYGSESYFARYQESLAQQNIEQELEDFFNKLGWADLATGPARLVGGALKRAGRRALTEATQEAAELSLRSSRSKVGWQKVRELAQKGTQKQKTWEKRLIDDMEDQIRNPQPGAKVEKAGNRHYVRRADDGTAVEYMLDREIDISHITKAQRKRILDDLLKKTPKGDKQTQEALEETVKKLQAQDSIRPDVLEVHGHVGPGGKVIPDTVWISDMTGSWNPAHELKTKFYKEIVVKHVDRFKQAKFVPPIDNEWRVISDLAYEKVKLLDQNAPPLRRLGDSVSPRSALGRMDQSFGAAALELFGKAMGLFSPSEWGIRLAKFFTGGVDGVEKARDGLDFFLQRIRDDLNRAAKLGKDPRLVDLLYGGRRLTEIIPRKQAIVERRNDLPPVEDVQRMRDELLARREELRRLLSERPDLQVDPTSIEGRFRRSTMGHDRAIEHELDDLLDRGVDSVNEAREHLDQLAEMRQTVESEDILRKVLQGHLDSVQWASDNARDLETLADVVNQFRLSPENPATAYLVADLQQQMQSLVRRADTVLELYE